MAVKTGKVYERATTTGPRQFRPPLFDLRCPDCELNGYLTADGRRRGDRRAYIRSCETCGGKARLRLITRDMLRLKPELIDKVGQPGWRFVARKETLDPYMFDVRPQGQGGSDGQQGTSQPFSAPPG